MATYSITGNQIQCYNSAPGAPETCSSTAFAGVRAWGTITVTDSTATYVTVSYTPYFTYGRSNSAPEGGMVGRYRVIHAEGSTHLDRNIGYTMQNPWARDDLPTGSFTINKGHSAASHTVQFRYDLASHTMKRYKVYNTNHSYPVQWRNNTTDPASDDTGSSSMSLGHATFTVPAKTSYTITYSANGGSSTPASQTKWHGESIKLPAAISRTGYTFAGWKWSGNNTVYSAGTDWNVANASGTMTAQWTANTYTISYNNNGGKGTIASQTKAYNASITLANTGFTKTDTLNGAVREYVQGANWATSATGSGSSTYPRGGQLGANTITSNVTLYAVWTPTYIYPTVTNLKVIRTDTVYDTDESDDGEFLYIRFGWTGYSRNANDATPTFSTPTCKITVDGTAYTASLTSGYSYRPVKLSTDTTAHAEKTYYTRSSSAPSGEYTYVYPYYYAEVTPPTGANPHSLEYYEFPSYSQDTAHTVTVELYDPSYTTHKATSTVTVSTAILPIDLYGEGTNVYMGIMHPYVEGVPLTMPDTMVDGDLTVNGSIKSNRNVLTAWDSVEVTATGQTLNICSLTIPANSKYLILTVVGTDKGGTLTLMNGVSFTNSPTSWGRATRTTTSSGQGVVNWYYVTTGNSASTATLQGYSYSDGSTGHNQSGTMIAIPL